MSAEVAAYFAKFGKNYGACGDDPFGDCIHLLAPGEYETTLCGQAVAEVCDAFSLESGWKPGANAGCWTCLERSNAWATPPRPHGSE